MCAYSLNTVQENIDCDFELVTSSPAALVSLMDQAPQQGLVSTCFGQDMRWLWSAWCHFIAVEVHFDCYHQNMLHINFVRSSLSTDHMEHCCQILIRTCFHCRHQSTVSSLKSVESLLSLEWVLILVIGTVWGCQCLLTAEDKEIELQWHHPLSAFHALGESQVCWSFIDGSRCSGQHSLSFLF